MGAFFVFQKHDVVAVCPKVSKDAANKGKQATKLGNTNRSPSWFIADHALRLATEETLIQQAEQKETSEESPSDEPFGMSMSV